MQFGADLSALIDRFSPEARHPIALAVSGGSDSLALLFLCHAWAETANRALIVFTVDHALRPEARDEAALVAEHCNRLQITHQSLRWLRPRPSQNAARRARYGLMADAMAEVGANCLLTGHTLDDVIETVFMRRKRGVRGGLSVGPGLAAPMPAWPEGRDMTLLRPLIGTRRQSLRTHLDELSVSWIEDPSNQDPKFERVRLRAFFERHQTLRDGILSTVLSLQDERADLDYAIGQLLAKVQVRPDGLIEVADSIHQTRLLGLLARVASGSDRDPRRSAVAAMVKALTEPGMRQTLGGAWFQRIPAGFLIGRDPAESTETGSTVFDGRFVRDSKARFPEAQETSFLVRHGRPPDSAWREIISERIAHMRRCYEAANEPDCAEQRLILKPQSSQSESSFCKG
ncbi:MAG: tRNA lysidine(34) synthetase TilS [Pseudomonadota bacterium]